MKMKTKSLNVKTGKPIVVLNWKEAEKRSIFVGDRVKITYNDKDVIAVVDTSKDIEPGTVLLFNEAKEKLSVDDNETVEVESAVKPDSLLYIKEKINREELSEEKIYSIVDDVVHNRLTGPEIMAYTIALEMTDFSMDEAQYLSEAMIETGETINFDGALDKHCIGGVAGNRTTPIIVAIVAAAGYKIPKTSSRAITSPAGTADVVEVFCDIEQSPAQIEKIVNDINGCMIWGGGINLAPADDKFIEVRKSLELDPLEQVLSSILAKKKSVGSQHVLIDIPVGKEAKVKDKEEANKYARYFKELGKRLGMDVQTMISDGSAPIGKGIGPILEAKDIVKILKSNGKEGPKDLMEKSIRMSDILLKQSGSDRKAREILELGDAYNKFKEIIERQNGTVSKLESLEPEAMVKTVYAEKTGKIIEISNKRTTRIARITGCPEEKNSGLYLIGDKGDNIEEGEPLYKIYSRSKTRLEKALEMSKEESPYKIESYV